MCEVAQRNLEMGVYGEGILNPRKENGVSFYQGKVREAVKKEWAREKMEREREEGIVKGKGKEVVVQAREVEV